LGYRLLKHKMTSYAKNWGTWPPGYACDSELRNNLNLHFKFAILIRQNKRNHLLFYVLHKILCKKIATVTCSFKIYI